MRRGEHRPSSHWVRSLNPTLVPEVQSLNRRRYDCEVLGKDYEGQDCALARALEVVGERWTLLIIRDAFYGVQRFSDFQAHLDIPRAILAQRLNGLVDTGILERSPDVAHAGRQLYRLTAAGRELWPALHALLV